MNLVSHSCQQTGKKSANWKKLVIGPPTNPATVPPQKFLSLLRYNFFVGVNEMRVKNITVTVSVRVSVTVRVSLVWFVSSNSFGGVKCRHLPATVVSPVSDAIDTTVVFIVHLWTIHDGRVYRVKYKGHDGRVLTSTNFSKKWVSLNVLHGMRRITIFGHLDRMLTWSA